MGFQLSSVLSWLLGPETAEPPDRPLHLWPRWLFLRAIGIIYFSAFYSLEFQIKGLIGTDGILPAGQYLQSLGQYFAGTQRFWYAPSMLWLGSGNRALEILCWAGLLASLLLIFNLWPRATLLICFVAFLSFVSVAQDFSGYQSDGMLLEAGFICLFFAPPGLRPGLGRAHPPSRASFYLLRWEWFRIYFESGVVKLASGDISWRHLTAMDDYYQNGPLPTWLGWYVQQLPHWFHASTTVLTLSVELVVVWMLFLPRRFRIILFCIVTPFEIAIILTANYAFLNYLVLSLGILLLDDKFLDAVLPERVRQFFAERNAGAGAAAPAQPANSPSPISPATNSTVATPPTAWFTKLRSGTEITRIALSGILFVWIFYATSAALLGMLVGALPLPDKPITLLEPFRIADRYGLFAVMTHERYEIEFQGSRDGKTWIPYPFRYKPQDLSGSPGIYAPYQPRFEWNLWFASLGGWRGYPWVVYTEERLMNNSPDVLELFAKDPFDGSPPQEIRAVIWQYWFTDLKTKRVTGTWWRREMRGLYCPPLIREPDGKIGVDESPSVAPSVPNAPNTPDAPSVPDER
ncbi:MAG: lipase maturation factor family protein [Candidatus Acidiferrales bacterium]